MGEHEPSAAERAVFYLERGRYEQAKSALNEALTTDPSAPHLLYLKAVIEFQTGDYDEARRSITTILGHSPHHPSALSILADIEIEEGNYERAEVVLLELLREQPDDVELLCSYARLMLLTLHVDKAASLAEEALSRAPDSTSALTTRALVGLIKRPRGRAVDEVAELIENNPDSEQTAVLLLQALADDGRTKEALAVAQQLVRRDPGNQSYVDVVVSLKAASHWSLIPLRPFTKWGFGGSAVTWVVVIGLLSVLRNSGQVAVAGVLGIVWLVFCIYSWVWPSLLLKILK